MAPCHTCTSQTICLSCREGLYLAGTTCLPCSTAIIGCQSCIAINVCITCDLGYMVTAGNGCAVCSFPCDSCSGTTSTCLSCAMGFYLSVTTCLHCDANCSQC